MPKSDEISGLIAGMQAAASAKLSSVAVQSDDLRMLKVTSPPMAVTAIRAGMRIIEARQVLERKC